MDFKQDLITTIHEYGVAEDSLANLRKDLKRRPTAILIPCLFDEFKRPSLNQTKEVLKDLQGLNELVIALSAKSANDEGIFLVLPEKEILKVANKIIKNLKHFFIFLNTK